MKKIAGRRSSDKKTPSGRAKAKHKAKGKVQTKTVYRVKNWSAYNPALVGRGSLTVWLSEEALSGWHYAGPPQRGAQFYYSDLAIETSLTLRVLLKLPLRQTQGFLESLLGLLAVDLEVPDYSTLSRRQASVRVVLSVRPKGEPLHLVVDSTGVKIYGEGEWKVRLHGKEGRRTWRKLHLGIDADTGEIVAQTLTGAAVGDGSQFKELLAQINGQIARCYGDGAYDQWSVLHTLAYPPSGQPTPIEAVIPPRRDAQLRKAKRHYRHIDARNERVRAVERLGRKRWKKQTGYHRRSLGESGVSRFKRIMGPRLRSRATPQQQVEARIGCGILNRMIHLGKPETYRVELRA